MNLEFYGVVDSSVTFENTKSVTGFNDVLKAFKSMLEDNHLPLLFVYGGTGNGKSRCCDALVTAFHKKNMITRRDRWCDLVMDLKRRFGSTNGGYEDFYDRLRKRERLIIDDVGNGTMMGQWEWSLLDDIVDYRYERRLFTVITSNLDLGSIPERIVSRFKDKTVARLVLNKAPDYRPGKVQ